MTFVTFCVRMARSVLIAIVTFIPIGASILSFVSAEIHLQIFVELIDLKFLTALDYLRVEWP